MPDQAPTIEPARTSALSLRQAHMLQTEVRRGGHEELADDAITMQVLLRLAIKYKWMLLAVVLLSLLVSVVRTLTSTPLYQAVTTLQIERPAARIMSFNKDMDQSENDDYLSLPTQVELLRSRALAERVVDELNLDPARGQLLQPGVLGPTAPAGSLTAVSPPATQAAGRADTSYWGALGDLKNRLVAGYENMGKPAVSDRQVLGREAVVGALMGSVTIEPVRQSRLVRIRVVSSDPAKAARVANGMAQTFIAMSMDRRMESSVFARNFLQDQLRATKARLEESERTLNAYAKANSLLTLDEKTNVINQTFTDYSAALSKVEQERVKAEALYTEMARNPESASQVLDNKTVQAFKEQKAKLEAEYLINLSVYKPDFPKMVQTRAQIAELDSRIKAEVAMVLASVKSQYDAAQRQEEQVRARLGDTRKEVLVSQDRSVDLNLLKRDLDTNRQMYDNLLQRLKEVGVSSGLITTNISVADAAKAPLFPFKPDMRLNAAIGLAVGLVLGVILIFVREFADDSIKHVDEVEGYLGLPLLGIIPMVKKKRSGSMAQLTVDDPRGAFAEAYRSMRTALQFSTPEGAPRRVMVTSSVKGEGKSTTALALAINFAQLGKRVLMVDADMRNPSIHKSLDLSNEHGLSNYLSGEGMQESLIRTTSVPNLSVMTAGPMPPSPVDLLMGPKLLLLLEKAEELGYEQLVIDAPPLLGIADAVVLGNQIHSMLFVVKAGSTRRSSIKDALRRMRIAGLQPLGVVLTRASSQHTSYHAYESYYGYGNDKGQKSGEAVAARLDANAA